jgi:hypothetical protein
VPLISEKWSGTAQSVDGPSGQLTGRSPLPDDLTALKQIIGGQPADPETMQRLINCNLLEEFDGTALLTESGIQAAARLVLVD